MQPLYPNCIQNQYNSQNTISSQRNTINNDSFSNQNKLSNRNQFHILPISFNIPKQKQNINYTARTPSPSYNKRNVINLNDNRRLKNTYNSPVYRKLKEVGYINNTFQLNNGNNFYGNIPSFSYNEIMYDNRNTLITTQNTPNYNHYNTLEQQSPQKTTNIKKKRKIVIKQINKRKLSYDNINYNMNISSEMHNTLENNKPHLNNNKINHMHHLSNNNISNHNYNYNYLKKYNGMNQNNNNNINNNYIQTKIIKNNIINKQNNINIKIFYSLKKNQKNTHINPFINNKDSIEMTSYNQNQYTSSHRNNEYYTSNNIIDKSKINSNNYTNSSRNYNNSTDKSRNYNNNINYNTINSINSIDMNTANDISQNGNNTRNKNVQKNINKNNSNYYNLYNRGNNLYYNKVYNTEQNIEQDHINIIPIPKNKIHRPKEKGIIMRPSKDIFQTNLVPNDDFNPQEFKIIKQIGVGGFGKIYSVQWIKNNQIYALKELNLDKDELYIFQDKVKIVKDLVAKTGHNGFIKIYGDKIIPQKDKDKYHYFIIMELGERDWLQELKNRESYSLYYSEKELFEIINQLVKTLALMQKNKVTHRDLKPQNILLCKGVFKLCDFGESKILKGNGKVYQHIRGSQLYMSPIIFYALKRKEKNIIHNTYKSDVFSLGMCFLIAAGFSRKLLCDIREIKDINIIYSIINNALNCRYSQKLINLIVKMLQLEENLRCDFIELEKYLSSISIN